MTPQGGTERHAHLRDTTGTTRSGAIAAREAAEPAGPLVAPRANHFGSVCVQAALGAQGSGVSTGVERVDPRLAGGPYIPIA